VRSAYVAQLGLQLTNQWRLNTAYQWSPNTRQTGVAAFELQRRIGADGIFNFAYRFRRGLLEQYTTSAVFPVSDRWRLMAAWTYSPQERQTVEALAGVEYDSCCVALRLVGRTYINKTNYGYGPVVPGSNTSRRDNAIMFELVFKGLGSTGGQIDPLLHRDILGYQ
jgi:LPS-assembly protein